MLNTIYFRWSAAECLKTGGFARGDGGIFGEKMQLLLMIEICSNRQKREKSAKGALV